MCSRPRSAGTFGTCFAKHPLPLSSDDQRNTLSHSRQRVTSLRTPRSLPAKQREAECWPDSSNHPSVVAGDHRVDQDESTVARNGNNLATEYVWGTPP